MARKKVVKTIGKEGEQKMGKGTEWRLTSRLRGRFLAIKEVCDAAATLVYREAGDFIVLPVIGCRNKVLT